MSALAAFAVKEGTGVTAPAPPPKPPKPAKPPKPGASKTATSAAAAAAAPQLPTRQAAPAASSARAAAVASGPSDDAAAQPPPKAATVSKRGSIANAFSRLATGKAKACKLMAAAVDYAPDTPKTLSRRAELQLLFGGVYDFSGQGLLREGPLTKMNHDGSSAYHFILTGTVFVYAIPCRTGKTLELHRAIPVAEVCVHDAPADKIGRNWEQALQASKMFTVHTPSKSFVVVAPTRHEAAEWRAALNAAASAAHAAAGTTPRPLSEVAPVWAQDSTAHSCHLCHREFGVLLRRHHCRRCGSLSCQKCASETLRLDFMGEDDLFHRVCKKCYADVSDGRSYGHDDA